MNKEKEKVTMEKVVIKTLHLISLYRKPVDTSPFLVPKALYHLLGIFLTYHILSHFLSILISNTRTMRNKSSLLTLTLFLHTCIPVFILRFLVFTPPRVLVSYISFALRCVFEDPSFITLP